VRWREFYEHPVDTQALDAAGRAQAFRAALARHKDRLTGRAALRLARLLLVQAAEAYRGRNCATEILGSRHVHIDPYGYVFPGTCCGIILGCARTSSVADLWQDLATNWRRNPVVEALVTGGSYELLQRAKALGYPEDPRGYASKCHLCADIRQFLVDRSLWPEFVGPPECYATAAERAAL
jgi:hypothetical protein